MSVPRAKADDTRERLLHAAAEVFSAKGFESATVREICKLAGANVALINYHFGDKLELYTEVLRSSIETGKPERTFDPLDGDPEEALRQMIRAMLERALDNGSQSSLRYRLMLHEFVHTSSATARVVDVTIRPVYDRLREIVGAILGVSPEDPKTCLCVHSVIGQVVHYGRSGPVLTALWPKLRMTPSQREMVADHIAELMLTYLRAVRLPRPPNRPQTETVDYKE
jgi:TetR/AcrR family transcriptional regulator, regulator of cefoperazone and chloramphenicol sensitivity